VVAVILLWPSKDQKGQWRFPMDVQYFEHGGKVRLRQIMSRRNMLEK